MAAVGHGGAIRDIRKQESLRASTLEALCREVGLEFYVGPPRAGALARAVNGESTTEQITEAAKELDRLRGQTTEILLTKERERQRCAIHDSYKRGKELARQGRIGERGALIDVPYGRFGMTLQGATFVPLDGGPRIWEDAIAPWASRDDLALIDAQDDSMRPELELNDLILLDRSQVIPIENHLFLAVYPVELAIRRVRRLGPGLALCPDTMQYPDRWPLWLTPETATILGQAAWHGSWRSPDIVWPQSRLERL